MTATAFREEQSCYLIVASNLYKAQKIHSLLSSYLPDQEVLLFPSDELIRAETLAQTKEMVARRLYVLNEVQKGRAKIVVANVAAATRYLPDPELFSSGTREFRVGEEYDFRKIRQDLVKAGYSLVNKVDQSLQFAVRGDIIDIFSVNSENPTRLEFFGDELESIRNFDIAKQTSINNVDRITVLPANDILLSEKELARAGDRIFDVLEKDRSHHDLGTFESLRNITETDVSSLIEGNYDPNLYKYFALLTEKHFSIFDYCKDFVKVLVDDAALKNSNDILQKESTEYLYELSSSGRIISHLSMYQDLFGLFSLHGKNTIVTQTMLDNFDEQTFDVKPVPFEANKTTDAFNIIHSYLNENYDVVLSLGTNQHLNLIQEGLINLGIPYEKAVGFSLPKKAHVSIGILNLTSGFVLPYEKVIYLTGTELFNEKIKVTHYDGRFREATILKSFEDLQPGDYVVHEYQGIGQFVSLETLEVDGVHRDYLKIVYSGNELLYVPLNQFQLVRKYMGKEGAIPRLSHLHTKDWENTKRKIKERINDLAERLMKLYLERGKVPGYAFSPDDEYQAQFEASFPYELTPDQQRAVDDIKRDMESPHPMDRLLCGDVGFGKTEVAFRAAFKAIDAGKQVAILCPTTLLARQHYETALERFSKFDVHIAVFSRLIPEKTQEEYIKEVEEGKAHLIIGTHRLLSKSIHFKDLGLVIVDEEQRFGVEQKERLKELKTNIDVLTLSATPIPRTLQISLLGVRSLSRINTAPMDRMPIQTYVMPYRQDIVKEVIERELGRNGQVFYLHNNISTIYYTAAKLQKMLPGAAIAVTHGQMEKDVIEDTMMKFYRGDVQVLVCTSIVENGIDVPNANMIIVEEADKYGLSQLYQIKGRVGRSSRIAYAYLMYNEYKVMNENAKKRLKAIQDFTALGSGYKIAQRDLMIRGAGDILGPEQAGFIDSIGLDMYIKLLNESVHEKLSGAEHEDPKANPNLSLDAYIPTDYASNSDKIEMYQEILSAPDLETLASIKIKTRDIYGKLPEQVEKLFEKRSIDLLTETAKAESLKENGKFIEIYLGKDYVNIRGIGNILFEALIPFLSIIKISYANNKFKIVMTKRQDWTKDLEKLLRALASVQMTNKVVNDNEA